MKTLVMFSDGGSRGNPGVAGCGFIIYGMNEPLDKVSKNIQEVKLDEAVIDKKAVFLGETTNNQAEWRGVLLGLKLIVEKYSEVREIRVYLDSELVVKQINGVYKVKNSDLKPIYFEVVELLKNFSKYEFIHVRREYNKEADELANEAMDKQV